MSDQTHGLPEQPLPARRQRPGAFGAAEAERYGIEKEYMKNWINKIVIKSLLRKQGRESIPLGSSEALNNDDLYLHLINKNDNSKYYNVESIYKNEIKCFEYINEKRQYITINLDSINEYHVKVSYYYKNWNITYDNLYEVFFHIFLGIIKIRRLRHNVYIKRIGHFTNRMKLMEILVDLQRDTDTFDEKINMTVLCERVYGKKYMQYQQYPYFRDYNNFRFLLLSLRQSGDVDFKDDYIISDLKVLPKILDTLSNYEIDMSKHIDSIKINRRQLLIAFLLLLVTISSLILSYFTYIYK